MMKGVIILVLLAAAIMGLPAARSELDLLGEIKTFGEQKATKLACCNSCGRCDRRAPEFASYHINWIRFSVTALVWLSFKCNRDVSEQVPLWELLWLSIVANLSITAMNFSLMLTWRKNMGNEQK